MTIARKQRVLDGFLLLGCLARVEIDLRLEITFRLQIFGQFALAFDQQVLIDRLLLINRDKFAQLAAGNPRPLGSNESPSVRFRW